MQEHAPPPHDVEIPAGWTLAADGTTFIDGYRALDAWLYYDPTADAVIYDDPCAGYRNAVPPLHEHGGYTEHALEHLDPEGHHDALPEMVSALAELLPAPLPDLSAEIQAYLAQVERGTRLQGSVKGGAAILDFPADTPAVVGSGGRVLHAEGESLVIVGPQGVGKTTVGQQHLLARIGIRSDLLGMTVKQDERKVIYLGMDRPRQIVRSFRRMVSEAERAVLDERVAFWFGALPPEVSNSLGTALLPWLLETFGAFGTVYVDSYKDLNAGDLKEDSTGNAINAASQAVCLYGAEWVGMHHQRKAQAGNKKPTTLSDVYGSTWISAGAGSVLLLHGEAGAAVVEGIHLKQPAEPVGPLTITHDHQRGISRVLDLSPVDGERTTDRDRKVMAAFMVAGGAGAVLGLADLEHLGGASATREALKRMTERGTLDYAAGGGREKSTWTMRPLA